MAKTPTPMQSADAAPPETAAAATENAASVDQESPTAEDPSPDGDPATIEARVLVDWAGFAVNEVVLLTEAEAARCGHWADTDPDAVAYARSLA